MKIEHNNNELIIDDGKKDTMEIFRQYLKLIRIKHFVKNFLIFAPLMFAGKLFDVEMLIRSLVGFITFSLMSSVVYIFNDIKDLEHDKNHPIKRNRPLACDSIKVSEAILLLVVLCITAFALNAVYYNTLETWILLICYFIINFAYTMGLKKVPIVDIFIIVSGYIIRVKYGGEINSIEISQWMYLTVMSLSFYLAFGKRRNEIKKNGNISRAVLKYYNVEFLDKNMYLCLSLTIVFYSFWCLSPNQIIEFSSKLIYTIPLIMIICMRYSMNIEGDSFGDPADVLFNDKILLLLIFAYVILLIYIIYGL
jgi:4-hydroxybenzoate polyprenyltransferase